MLGDVVMTQLDSRPNQLHRTPETEASWRRLYRAGAVAGFVATALLIGDIALSGVGTVPETASAWLAQLRSNPWLGLRNLDLLNASLAVVTLPLSLAIYGAHRRSEPALTALGVSYLLGALSTLVFSAALLRHKIFGTLPGRMGLVTGLTMLIPPNVGQAGLVLSMLSLLPTAAWLALLSAHLFRLGRDTAAP